MQKFMLVSLAALALVVLAFVLHVPALKYFTTPSADSGLSSYDEIADGVQGQGYRIDRILYGHAFEIFHEPETGRYHVLGHFVEPEPGDFAEHHLITLDADGNHIETNPVRQDDLDAILDNPNLIPIPAAPETQYSPNYSFDDTQGAVELVHYQFQEFREWPGLFYFIPVVFTDWLGTAYLKITHGGEVFHIQLPTDYDGGFLYSGGNVDGQVYLRARPGETSGLAFLEVGESSYTRDMDGNETHRGGYGLYVVRRK